jgi:hypothetical protein
MGTGHAVAMRFDEAPLAFFFCFIFTWFDTCHPRVRPPGPGANDRESTTIIGPWERFQVLGFPAPGDLGPSFNYCNLSEEINPLHFLSGFFKVF